jgi:hypothetical protein
MTARNLTAGAAAAAAWFDERGLDAPRAADWYAEIAVETNRADVWLEIDIYPSGWSLMFQYSTRVSSIRFTDTSFVQTRDDHNLLARAPSLERIGELLAQLEQEFNLTFHRSRAVVRSNLIRGTAIVRAWLLKTQ